MRKGNAYSGLAACVCFVAFVTMLLLAILCGLLKEFRAYCQEYHASADWLDCENWGVDCEDIA